MSELRGVALTIIVFMLLVGYFSSFYSDSLSRNGVTPVTLNLRNDTFIKQYTSQAGNTSLLRPQPTTASPLDFFFSLPSLFLGVTVDVASTLLSAPTNVLNIFASFNSAVPTLGLANLGEIAFTVTVVIVVFAILFLMRGYRA